jgi:hypothetical protein
MTFDTAAHPRATNGQFAEKLGAGPEIALIPTQPIPIIAANPAPNAEWESANEQLHELLEDYPDAAANAAKHMESPMWKPTIRYISQGEELSDESADAYLTGDDETLDENVIGDEDNDFEYIEELAKGIVGSDEWDDLDYDTQDELKDWVREHDDSNILDGLIGATRSKLMQFPVTDDDDFGVALSEASDEEDEDERRKAITAVFEKTLTDAGLEMNDTNREAIATLINENSLDFEHQASEQWKLRILSTDDVKEYGMSGSSPYRDAARDVQLTDPYILLIDPWNGRGMDAKLEGTITSRISPDSPVRLDAQRGYGSWDEVAGVVKSAYRSDNKVTNVAEND